MHVEKLPSGKWRAEVRVRGHRRRTAAVDTRNEALQLGAELTLQMGGAPPVTTRVTVGDLVAAHISNVEFSGASPVTGQLYRDVVANVIPNEFLTRPAEDVTPPHLLALYRTLSASFSAHRLRQVHVVLSGAYRAAMGHGLIRSNPTSSARPPRIPESNLTVPSPLEVQRLIAAASNDQHRLFLHLAAATGARRGELAGLRWSALDLARAQIAIEWSLVEADHTLTERRTKTGCRGWREFSLDPTSVHLLQAWRRRQVAAAVRSGMGDPIWPFGKHAGSEPVKPHSLTTTFMRTRTASGLSGFRLHDLRHFNATQLLAAGVDIRIVSYRLGHRSIQTTIDRYGHWIPGTDTAAAGLIGDIVTG